jgi:hypothetical protein
MSHVDEGALHAYLDGALDEYPAAEAERVRDHLARCPECADRLEWERRVREHATAILGLAVPEVTVPSLEELRAYVRSMPPSRTWASVRLYRLGWAASVVLAVGAGWMLRGGGVPTAPPTVGLDERLELEAARRDRTGEPGQATTPYETAGGVSGRREVAAPATSDAEAAVPVVDAPAVVADRVAAAPEGDRALVAGTEPTEARAGAAEDAAAVAMRAGAADAAAGRDSSAGAVVGALADDRAALARRAAEPVPSAAEPVPRAAEPVPSAAEAAVAEAVSPPPETVTARVSEAPLALAARVEPGAASAAPLRSLRADVAGASTAGSLVVPGLEVLEVVSLTWRQAAAAPGGVRVLQRLETGDTLELTHLPDGVDPSVLPPLDEHLSELVVPRQVGWLVMRAPVAATSLAELLQRLDSIH